MAVRIQLRRDTAAEWNSKNPVLAEGEFGLEKDTARLKIGDGSTTWSALDYLFDEPAGNVVSVNGHTGIVDLTAADVGADPYGAAVATVAAHESDPSAHPQYALASMLGTAAVYNVPSSGDATTTQVVKGSDTRLTNSRAPTAHTHTASQISDSTTPGRALLTAVDVAAQRTALALGSSATLNVPASGNAATTEVVKGSDTRLSDARTPTAHTHTASQISDGTTAGRAILTAADAAAQRAALALATLAASVFYGSPVNGSVTVSAKAAFSMTLNQLRGLKTSAGALTLSVQINGTNVTGLSGLNVTTSAQDVSASGANAVAAGDRITIVIASASSAAGLEFTLSATR
ncbi:GK12566 gene product from transcript GK12566-RA OS=Fibrisoma limi BUZ 3 GN=BN8_03672 PE=4 SV=1 [Gemmata massiliana]|uniref:GK12566 gene product from transcript GK12566-RA n=1 Tax=Gemmata massiliana TaxID=1210884 RepID=A0A6P2D561_9BACT|nr:hypothetical protein [Gemmata massiliana]VTR95224.1 GK12566 gene product from transcript GK12566-RA OS=Fibrisoma limi BUZ 3 GN=BN8_03672 PE=4 SV=1 [Gemmata massiliana]